MTRFEVWAPNQRPGTAACARARPRDAPAGGGRWRDTVPDAGPGTDYGFLLGDAAPRCPTRARAGSPTASTRCPGCTTTARTSWGDGDWTGRQLAGAVVYELHVGTFTPEGTFAAAVDQLDHLVDSAWTWSRCCRSTRSTARTTGATTAWAGTRCTSRTAGRTRSRVRRRLPPARARAWCSTWSTTTSGRPGRTCRGSGRTSRPGRTTWGDLVNLDGPGSAPVRRYILDNALMWLHDYHVDGLRLDAVHALVDTRRQAPAGGAVHRGGGAVRRTCAGR